jgi:hypothetical protein
MRRWKRYSRGRTQEVIISGVLAVFLTACTADHEALNPVGDADMARYGGLVSIVDSCLSTLFLMTERTFAAREFVDTNTIDGISWPVELAAVAPTVIRSDSLWLKREYASSSVTERVQYSSEIAWTDSTALRPPSSADSPARIVYVLSCNCRRTPNAEDPRDWVSWDCRYLVEASHLTSDTALTRASCRIELDRDECGDRSCEAYYLQLIGQCPLDVGTPCLGIVRGGIMAGTVIESGAADSTGSGTQVTWYLKGKFLGDGNLELSASSGHFAITDTLRLCP